MLKPFRGLSWKAFGATWVKLGVMWDFGGAILGLIGRSQGLFGSTLGANVEGLDFGVWRLGLDRHNTCFLEMQKSHSTYACAAKTLTWKADILSHFEITH